MASKTEIAPTIAEVMPVARVVESGSLSSDKLISAKDQDDGPVDHAEGLLTVDSSKRQPGRAAIGCTVEVEMEDGSEQTFSLGEQGESDVAAGVISCNSPIGVAILGGQVGETRHFQAGGRVRQVTLKDLR